MQQADLARAGGHFAVLPQPDRAQPAQNRRQAAAATSRARSRSSRALLTEGAEAALIDGAARGGGATPRGAAAPSWTGSRNSPAAFPAGRSCWPTRSAGASAALERTVETLTDRLAHDPHLAASLHEVLSTVTAIRSTASILAETGGARAGMARALSPQHRRGQPAAGRRRPSAGALSRRRPGDAGATPLSPQEEVDAFLAAAGLPLRGAGAGRATPAETIAGSAAERLGHRRAQLLARTLERYARRCRARCR